MAERCGSDTAILAIASTMLEVTPAGMPERPKGADCKSAGNAFGGSNPSPGTKRDPHTQGSSSSFPVAGAHRMRDPWRQLNTRLLSSVAEHLHGKEGVPSSNLGGGSPTGIRDQVSGVREEGGTGDRSVAALADDERLLVVSRES